MNSLQTLSGRWNLLIESPQALRIGSTLLHFLWQGTVIAIVAWIVLSALRRARPQVKYVALLTMLGLAAACPVVTFCVIRPEPVPAEEVAILTVDSALPTDPGAIDDLTREASNNNAAEAASSIRAITTVVDVEPPSIEQVMPPVSSTSAVPVSPARPGFESFLEWLRTHRPWAVALWLAGVIVLSVRLAIGLVGAEVTRRRGIVAVAEPVQNTVRQLAERLGIRRAIRVFESRLAEVPTLVGWLRPVILLPASAMTGLTASQLEAILAHELAHIRRNDAVVNLLQTVVETLLFYHPAVWWLSRRIRQEREHCCDDVAVSVCGDRVSFARALTAMEELRAAPRWALTARGGSLVERIRRVVGRPQTAPQGRWGALLVVAVLTAATAAALQDRLFATAGEAATADSKESEKNEEPTKPVTPSAITLVALIDQVKQEEAKLQNLDVQVRQTSRFGLGSFSFGGSDKSPKEAIVTDEVYHAIMAGPRVSFTGTQTQTIGSNTPREVHRATVFDGTQTVSIEEGDSVCIHETRYEPSQYLPPHALGVFSSGINFPLSVFLEGTEALEKHPKVRRLAILRGFDFQFGRVDVEIEGKQSVDGLDCIVVRARRWTHDNSDPLVQQLWLAKDRNYHVARFRSYFPGKDGSRVGEWGLDVKEWLNVTPLLWVPKIVERVDVAPRNPESGEFSQRLVVERFVINPKVQDDAFALPTVPSDLPVFRMSADGRLIGSPHHPQPANADPATTLDSILARLETEEGKLRNFDARTTTRYRMLNFGESMRGVTLTSTHVERSVAAGDRTYYEEDEESQSIDGARYQNRNQAAFDGDRSRTTYNSYTDRSRPPERLHASLYLDDKAAGRLVWPHTQLMRGDGQYWDSLVERFRSGWFDPHDRYLMKVEYVGDETIDSLHCHKLRCQLHDVETKPMGSYFILWLARDRNLIPIRREFFSPVWKEGIPSAVSYIDDLREIKPGVWFPWHSVTLPFRRSSDAGLCENRPILQWRRETTVDSVTADPQVEPSLFTTIEVPKGTKIQISENDDFFSEYTLADGGNIDVPADKLQELRQKAEVERHEREQRDKALQALIGNPAPELPAATWLNSEPLSWKSLAGKVVVLDFWAVWCGPCAADLDRLAEIHKRRTELGTTDQVIIGVHTAGTDEAEVRKAVDEKKLGYPIVIDSLPESGRSWGKLFEQFAVQQIPMTMVVDREGKVVAYGRLEEMLSKAGELARAKEPQKDAKQTSNAPPPPGGTRLALPAGPIAMDAVVARVNGEPITAGQLLVYFRKELESDAGTLSPDAFRKRQVELLQESLRPFVEQELLVWAVKSKLTPEQWTSLERQLDRQFEQMLKSTENDGFDIESESKETGLSVAELRKMFCRSLIAQQYLDTKIGELEVSPEEAKTAYRDRAAEFMDPTHVHWQQLQISFTGDDGRAAARRAADECLKMAQEGQAFEAIASARSSAVFTVHEGDGKWTRQGAVAKELHGSLEMLTPGSISDVIETPDSYRIVKVTARESAKLPPFEQAEDRIVMRLTEEKREARTREITAELRKQFPVATIFDESPTDESRIVRQPAAAAKVARENETKPATPSATTEIPKGSPKLICRVRVLDSSGQPLAGASVKATSFMTHSGTSLSLKEEWFPKATTDADGRATITCLNAELLAQVSGNDVFGKLAQIFDGGPPASEEVQVEIDHPNSPRWHNRVTVRQAETTITLAQGSMIEVRAKRAEDGRPLARLAPSFGTPWGPQPDWSEQDGVLTIRRIDLTNKQSPRWMTVVHVPDEGPALFSDPVDLRQHTGEKLVVAMREGVRVEGALGGQIPRPVRNGRVLGHCVCGIPEKETWTWSAAADVREDGTFVFESVPPDVPLQIVGFCEGWVSRSTTLDELKTFKSRTGFWASERGMEEPGTLRPRLYSVSTQTVRLELPMEPTAECSVAVVDESEKPIEGAMVSFMPNLTWFNGWSTTVGYGADSLDWHRRRLATGRDPEAPGPSQERFAGTSGADGVVVIRNLPAGHDQLYLVAHAGYVALETIPEYAFMGGGAGFKKIALKPGESAKALVVMAKDSLQAAQEQSADAPR